MKRLFEGSNTIKALLLIIISLALVLVPSCFAEPEARQAAITVTDTSYYELQSGYALYRDLIVEKGVSTLHGDIIKSEPLILVDNATATNVTYTDLMIFLVDTRPQRDLINSFDAQGFPLTGYVYTCGYYIEQSHNSAEARGIRAGIAVLEFESGICHGISVFNTIDRGLVFIDPSYYADYLPIIKIGQRYIVHGPIEAQDNHFIVKDFGLIWEGYKP